MSTIVKTAGPEEFFERRRQIARLADQGSPIPEERVIAFEDPASITSLLSQAKLALFREVKSRPGSITDPAQRLHRDRSAVKRDVDDLASAGLLTVHSRVLPGHGRMKEIRAAAERIVLSAIIA